MANILDTDPNAPGAPTSGNLLDSDPNAPQKKRSSIGTPPALDAGYGAASGTDPNVTHPNLGKAVHGATTAIGNALNYQLVHGPLKAITGKSTYEEAMPIYRHKLGLDPFYNYTAPLPKTGVAPVDNALSAVNHFTSSLANNLMDAAITMPIDPLTWETFGTSALGKTAAGVAARQLAAKTLNKTWAGRTAFKALTWGGKAAIKRGDTVHGGNILPAIDEINEAQGAGHQATAEGGRWKAHINRRVNQIVNGVNPTTGKKIPGAALNETERSNVQHALNNEEFGGAKEGQYEPDENAPHPSTLLTPREQSAYRQLRALTAMDWRTRQQAALSVSLRSRIPDEAVRNDVRQAFKSGKVPEIPQPGKLIKTPYGEAVPRSRATYAEPQTAFVSGPSHTPTNSRTLIAYQQAVEGMTEPERRAFDRAIGSRAQGAKYTADFNNLDPPEQALANEILRVHQEEFGRPINVKELTAAPRYKMVPENQAAIEHATKVRDAYMDILGDISKGQEGGLMRYRQDYYPFQHHAPDGREAFTVNPAEHVDTRNLERPDLKITGAQDITKDFGAMAENLGRQVRTKALNDNLGSLLDDPEISDLFKEEIRATGGKRDDWQKAGDFMRALVGWPRAALIGITPGHAANEINAAMNVVPLERQPVFFAKATALAGKIFKAQMRGDDKEYARLTAPGRAMGAGVGSFDERKAFFQWAPKWTGVPWWTRSMNKLVWSVSEAIRQEYGALLLENGEAKTPLQAGGMAEKRLVDYQYRTPLQNAARLIAPFGTYRGGIPGSVVGGIVRDPRRAAALNRATGGAFYGDKPKKNQPGWEAFTPSAEVGRFLNIDPRAKSTGPEDFLRGSLSIPIVAGLDAAQDATSLKPKHWASYGQGWTPKKRNGQWDLGFLFDSAIAGVPEAQSILEANGIGRYKWKGILEELQRQFTRTQYTPPIERPTSSLLPAPTLAPPGGNILDNPP